MIKVNNLSFSYPTKNILQNISFSLKKGEILGILGANGAGKSTLFKLLNGRLNPISGSIKVDDKEIKDYPQIELAKKMALVPQNPTLRFPFTVYETIAMGRRPYHGLFSGLSPKDQNIIENVLNEAKLIKNAEQNVTELSGGETQLVFLARAFAQTPKILLLDEATASLDINHTLDILTLIKKRVEEKQLAVAAIIHDINMAAMFCDKILYISDGEGIGPGTPEEMITPKLLSKVYNVSKKVITISKDPINVQYLLQ